MLDRSALNKLSTALASSLFAVYPQWESLAGYRPGGAFDMLVPQPGADRYLWIATQDDEITVGYDYWHRHLGPFLGLSDMDAIGQAMKDIRAIVEEDMVIMTSFRDGRWAQSMHVRATTPIVTEPGGTTYVYSWRGTYDRVVEGIPSLIS